MLKRILNLIAENTGLNPNDPNQRAHMVEHVNLSAKCLHDSTDLENSHETEDFNVSVGTALVAFPPRVGEVRKIRYVQTAEKVVLGGPASRFNESGYNDANYLTIVSQTKRALERDIDVEGKLTFTLPIAQANDVSFTIVGKNSKASQVVETLVIPAGQLTLDTTNVFSYVTNLLRSGLVTVDCIITDLNNMELAIFPNNVIELEHQVVRVAEYVTSFGTNVSERAVEVYYKKALTSMEKDYDTFVCGDLYDEALAWNYIKSFGPTDLRQLARESESKILADIGRDKNKGQLNKVDVAPNKYYSIQQRIRRYSFRRRR